MSLQLDESTQVLKNLIKSNGLAKVIIDSYNHSMTFILPKVLKSIQLRTFDGKLCMVSNPKFLKPTMYGSDNKAITMNPIDAKRRELSYMADLYADLTVYDTNMVQVDTSPVRLGKIPVMIQSQLDNLTGLSDEEKLMKGEPSMDTGGYYIINGREFVLQGEQHLRRKVAILYYDSKENVYNVRYTSERIGETTVNVIMEKDVQNIVGTYSRIYSGANKKYLNIFVIFYMLGFTDNTVQKAISVMKQFIIDSDKKREEKRREKLEYYLIQSITAFENIKDINEVMKKAYEGVTLYEEDRNIGMMNSLRTDFLKDIEYNVADTKENITAALLYKIKTFAYMIVKYVDFMNGYRSLDNRDGWDQKTISLSGPHIISKFTSIYKNMMVNVQEAIIASKFTSAKDISLKFNGNYMAEEFTKGFIKKAWSSVIGKISLIVENFKTSSVISKHMSLSRVVTDISRKTEMREKRYIDLSSWNLICPVYTTENDQCGLVSLLAVATYISLDRDPDILKAYLKPVISFNPNPAETQVNPVFINGTCVGFCNSEYVKSLFDTYRRELRIPFDTGIILNEYNELHIYSTAGRGMIPYLVVNYKTGKLVFKEKGINPLDIKEMFKNGAIEYIDIAEQVQPRTRIADNITELESLNEYIFGPIAKLTEMIKLQQSGQPVDPEEISRLQNVVVSNKHQHRFTHCMIDKASVLGVSAFTIPYLSHNPPNRNTYQTNMANQALGVNNARYDLRFDTNAKDIQSGDVPLVATMMNETIGLERQPHGRTMLVAILPTATNQEDCIVLNKGAIDRGVITVRLYHSTSTVIEQGKDYHTIVKIPPHTAANSSKYQHLDPLTGIVRVGSYVKVGDCLIGKVNVNVYGKEEVDSSIYVEINKEGYVDEVFDTYNIDSTRLIVVRVIKTHYPEQGDKLASQYAQKGTIGQVKAEADIPTIVAPGTMLNGMRPSILFNPHGMPTRMTVAKFFEMAMSIKAIATGQRQNATAFRPFDYTAFINEMSDMGFNKTGKYYVMNGETGEMSEADIFIGFVYYQVLPHLVSLKRQARSTGKRTIRTRQPTHGHRKGGGLRLGEMERDVLIASGASSLVKERFGKSSNISEWAICKTCGQLGYPDEVGHFKCRMCTDAPDFGHVEFNYVMKLMTQLLAGISVKVSLMGKKSYI